VLLHAIKDQKCAVFGRAGVVARNNPSPQVVDSSIWIDQSVDVLRFALAAGYPVDTCEALLRRVFAAHSRMFVFDKALRKRGGTIPQLAAKLGCKRYVTLRNVWVFLSLLPPLLLQPLLWLRFMKRFWRSLLA
jgi:hypothetical protein